MNKTILDCRSSSCYFARDKSGQRTNGGCTCLSDLRGDHRILVTRFVRELMQENAALRAALAEITTAVDEGDPQAIADALGQVRGLVKP